jgi:hypothetical protein
LRWEAYYSIFEDERKKKRSSTCFSDLEVVLLSVEETNKNLINKISELEQVETDRAR